MWVVCSQVGRNENKWALDEFNMVILLFYDYTAPNISEVHI
jgi:hypothetical protein